MFECDGYVYCENVGGVHEDVPDPDCHGPQHGDPDEGPRYDMPGYPNPSWRWHEEPYRGYGGRLWHYTCPGPHRILWAGRQQEGLARWDR